ncbi:curli assembly protein CsgG [Cognatishimia sp. F0-27]|nr:curli assembly protein CsgG [Cognatishimia sp. F0-27]
MTAGTAIAGELTYQPRNPSFGGNPGNGGFLLSIANAQRNATARDFDDSSGSGRGSVDTGESETDARAELFVRQLESRLLSALASEVTEAIFGTDPQDSGRVEFGDTTITFERTTDSITLNIVDVIAGTTTTITVPQLVTN